MGQMARRCRLWLLATSVGLGASYYCVFAPTGAAQTSTLRQVHAEGNKQITEEQVASLAGLEAGAEISRDGLQSAADRLVESGLFAHVKYTFQSKGDGVSVTFTLEEAPRLPVFYDNFPWFDDVELNDAIRQKLPFYDGKLPPAGSVVDAAVAALNAHIATSGIEGKLEHQVLANPIGDGDVQEFHLEGAGLKIAGLTFSDPALTENKALRQHLSEITGSEYSRSKIDLFLLEQVRPLYLEHGNLRVKLGPPEVRLTGNPNQKLPQQIPVFVPVVAGPVYRLKSVEWNGISALSDLTLTGLIGLKLGQVADGMAIEAGWDRVREEYGHRGHLDAKLEPIPSYDENGHSVSYRVNVIEGPAYRYGGMVLTGLSPTAEKRLHESWLTPSGELFDKAAYEELLSKLESHREKVFGNLPVHYDTVGHWLQTDAARGTVNILLDFK
jgi:outer membrane protein assembly factor BamA